MVGKGPGYVPASEGISTTYNPEQAAEKRHRLREAVAGLKNRFKKEARWDGWLGLKPVAVLTLIAIAAGVADVTAPRLDDLQNILEQNFEGFEGWVTSMFGPTDTTEASVVSPAPGEGGTKTDSAPAASQLVATQEGAKAPSEIPAAEKVIGSYTLTDGDGITQGLMKLKAELGDQAPDWLKKLNTPAEYAEWAENNGWYAPGEERDSVVMHKGDVLRINALNELTIHSADGSFEARTDVAGRVSPEALGTRDFSDTVPTKEAPSVGIEISDAQKDAVLIASAKLGEVTLASFALENPHPTGTAEAAAWETVHSMLKTMPDDWKTSTMTLGEFLHKAGFVK